MIRVLVADDQDIVRAGLTMLLDAQPGIEVIGEAADGREAVTLARRPPAASSRCLTGSDRRRDRCDQGLPAAGGSLVASDAGVAASSGPGVRTSRK